MTERAASIEPTDDGFELPVEELLTGRGAIFGKSGSGKSNTVTVVLEELLERGLSFLVVDSDGEYFGLKEAYEVVRAGGDPDCDVQVAPEDADALAELALERDVPVLLDLSGYLDSAVADALVEGVLESLFHRERTRRQPFLVVLEEVHEYIPQSGGTDDLAETVVRVAKRGRKRGLGVLGVSQRPAAVDKDFITQCNWLVWHRLTWNNDVDVVRSHLGPEYAGRVEELDAGDAFLRCDWEESVVPVSFRLKRTFDAGATPGFEEFSPPPLVPVRESVLGAFGSTPTRDDDAPSATEPASTLPNVTAEDEPAAATTDAGAGSVAVDDVVDSTGGTTTVTVLPDDAGNGRRRASPHDDLVWETGQLVAYLVERTIHLARRSAGRLRTGVVAAARRLRRDGRRLWGDVRAGLEPAFGDRAGLATWLLVLLVLVLGALALTAI